MIIISNLINYVVDNADIIRKRGNLYWSLKLNNYRLQGICQKRGIELKTELNIIFNTNVINETGVFTICV